MEHWFRVNTINDAGNPSSATVGKRLAKTYMLIVRRQTNPTEDDIRAELTRIFKDETVDGETINTTYKFNEYILSQIERKALENRTAKSKTSKTKTETV